MSKLGNRSRERPYWEYFDEFVDKLSIAYVALLVITFIGAVIALIYVLFKGDQRFATISVGFVAFIGAMITVAIQGWLTVYKKSQLDQRRDGTNKMTPYYEGVLKLLKDPKNYSLEVISSFLDKFDNKVDMYGSETIVYQWKTLGLKERLLVIQTKPLGTLSRDWHTFRNFIRTIRREMGHTGRTSSTFYILRDLKSKYEKRGTSLAIHPSKSAVSDTSSVPEHCEKDI